VVLTDTNILSTFAKISELPLLTRLFAAEGIGVVPAVYEELLNGVSKGYIALKAAIELIQRRQIDLVMPTAEETLEKGALPHSFDEGERETIVIAKSRSYKILTNERLVRNWCRRAEITYCDLPGILRALWRTNLLTKEQVRRLVTRIEEKDRLVFRCLVPQCDGVLYVDLPSQEVLWDKYYTGAPAQQRQCVERYSIVKRA
jgi:predicted nucleic acid-binding protein